MKITKIVWREVVGYDLDFSDLYEVSNLGQIRNKKNKRVRKLFPDKDGYLRVFLNKGSLNGKMLGRNDSIHRIVAKAFLSNKENKPQVNHKDGDKSNNEVINLEWCTNQENRNHAIVTGLVDNLGEKNGNSKINSEQAKEVKSLIKNGITLNEISEQLGVSRHIVGDISCGKTWKQL